MFSGSQSLPRHKGQGPNVPKIIYDPLYLRANGLTYTATKFGAVSVMWSETVGLRTRPVWD